MRAVALITLTAPVVLVVARVRLTLLRGREDRHPAGHAAPWDGVHWDGARLGSWAPLLIAVSLVVLVLGIAFT
ncbi:hypothetical protein [Actinomadura nitritigenes]|uniref:Uncharacterized protein n=1 Tax=Actinomadura nitritigenes TaxID=134602 RepID=A0ABS3RAY4_9ACTN|nr:hypothetical protein [Actinomadura nitritigenes]MBO2443383.1 hypothetical protein [Actinomadura nitritigenes]